MRYVTTDTDNDVRKSVYRKLRGHLSGYLLLYFPKGDLGSEFDVDAGIQIQRARCRKKEGLSIWFEEIKNVCKYHVTVGEKIVIVGPTRNKFCDLADALYRQQRRAEKEKRKVKTEVSHV